MRGRVLAGLALLALAGCGRNPDALVDYRLLAMATSVELRLPADGKAEHPGLLASLGAELEAFGTDYYAWADGELARINRELTATGESVASEGMASVLGTSLAVAEASDGAFDPGVGALVELWGFNDGDPPVSPPPDAAIDAALARAGSIRDLVIAGTRIAVAASAVAAPTVAAPAAAPGRRFTLDLGGIAKGTAVDRIVAALEARAIAPALVNAGGDLRVIGTPADRSWRIGIQAPRAGALLGTLRLEAGEAAFTSGDYERYFDRDGERLHHILDPRTGRPVRHTQAVTVIAANGTLADAAATALFVAGPDDWRALATRLGLTAVLRVDADGSIEMTASMRDRFQESSARPSDIIAAGD
jgi:thiamine biosynthesis lipoprotein